MMLTSLNVVSPSTSMNVVRIDTAGDEQREQREERREHEEQHEESTGRAEQRLDQDARLLLVAACGRAGRTTSGRSRSLRPPPPSSSAGSSCVSMYGPELHRQRRLDQGVRRAAVVGDEARIAGAREVDDPQRHVRHGGHRGREDPRDGVLVLLRPSRPRAR